MNRPVFDEDIYNTIRRNVKKYRKEKGLTAAALAEISQVAVSAGAAILTWKLYIE